MLYCTTIFVHSQTDEVFVYIRGNMLHGYVSFKISAGVLWGQAHTVVDGRVGSAELWSGRVWAPGHRLHGGLVSPRSAGIARVDGCGAGGRRV